MQGWQDTQRYGATLESLPSDFTTGRGRELRSRLMQPTDAPLLIDLHLRLSPEARGRRFHQPLGELDPPALQKWAKVLTRVDNHAKAGAVLAVAGEGQAEEIIGVARLMCTRNQGEVEAAIVVRDDYQGEGVATELLKRLVLLAKRMHAQTIYAMIEADNVPALRVLRGLSLPTRSKTGYGETELSISVLQDE